MKNLSYSASMTRQPDRRKGVNLAKKGVEISISFINIQMVYMKKTIPSKHYTSIPY